MKSLVVAFEEFPGLGWVTLNSSTKSRDIAGGRRRGDVTHPGQLEIEWRVGGLGFAPPPDLSVQ